MNKKEMNNKGFSLVELIIVIAIMAILVGVLAPQFIKYVESSRQSTDIQNASEIRAAIEAFVAENSPTSDITVTVSATDGLVVSGGMSATDLAAVGLSDKTPLRSSGWPAGEVGKYGHDTYKWTATSRVNSKQPAKDLSSAFK